MNRNVMKNLKVKDYITVKDLTVTGTLSPEATTDNFVELTATAAGTITSGMIALTHGSVAIVTDVPAPGVAGKSLIIRDTTTGASHVVTSTGGTFDGTNNTATFDAAGEQLILYSVSATEWIIVLNSGSVAMSDV